MRDIASPFDTLDGLGGLGGARPVWVAPGSTVDLWRRHSLYWALGRRYAVSAVPGLDAYAFENFEATSIKGLATVTRAGQATVVQDGEVVSVAAGMPRVGDAGLLVEEARTNLALNSAEPGGASYTGSGVTPTVDASVAPDGSTSMDRMACSSGGYRRNLTGYTVTPGSVYTYSFYSANQSGTIYLRIYDVTNATDIVTGDEYFTTGTQRQSTTFTAPAGCVSIYAYFVSGASAGASVDIWGVQLEEGAFATTYIPTAGASVTRAADSVTIPTSEFDFNAAAGTVFVEMVPIADQGGSDRFLSLHVDAANTLDLYSLSSNRVAMFSFVGGAPQANTSIGTYTPGATTRAAFAWAANDFAGSLNGATSVVDTAGTIPTGITTLKIGDDVGTTRQSNCPFRKVYYYASRLTNAQIEGMTAGTIEPATLSPVLSLDFVNRTYSRGGDPFAETVLSDNFSGYGSQAEAEAAGWVFGQSGPGGWVFDAALDKAKCDTSNTGTAYFYKSVSGLIPGQAYVADVVSAVSGAWTSVYGTAPTDGALATPSTTSVGSNLFPFIAPADGEVAVSMGANAGDADEITSVTIKRVELYLTGIDTTLGLSATESFDITFDDATTSTQAAVGGKLAILATNNPLARVTA